MADSSALRRYTFSNAGPNSFFAVVDGSDDPDISIDVGTPIAPSPNENPVFQGGGQVFIGTGDTEDNSAIVGLAASANEAGQRILIQFAGPLSQPTSWWDKLTGLTGGLTPGARYYITNNPKELSTSPDGVTFPVQVGIALSKTTMLIQIAKFVSA